MHTILFEETQVGTEKRTTNTVARSETEEKSTKLDSNTLIFSCNDWLNMLHYFLIEQELGRVLYEN
jgi:hypothetical protein